jgi:dolichyl-phosphate-mannose--protein O-mannosyl transferase
MSWARALLAAGAVALGLAAGRALSGRIVTVAILALLVAAGNGYSKAYSP